MLSYTFKRIALTNKVTVTDNDTLVLYAHQKLTAFKENIAIFTDLAKTNQVGYLKADKVIDFSPTLTYRDSSENVRFAVKRHGGRSIWRAQYDIVDSTGMVLYKVSEDSPIVKVLDSLFGEIPVIGLFAGYVFHAKYNIDTPGGERVAQIRKLPAFLESRYEFDFDRRNDPLGILPTAILAVLTRERMRS